MNAAGPVDVVVVLSTAPAAPAAGQRGAQELARQLVAERLCACVNVVPGVTSLFRWQGAVDRGDEQLLVIKTTRAAEPALRRRLLELHPYDLPEVVVLPVLGGHAPYLDWVAASVAPRPDRDVGGAGAP